MQTEKNFIHRQTQLSAAKQALLEKRLKQLAMSASVADASEIGPRPAGETIPLSFAQQRLWFLQQLEPESAAYNEAMAARLQGSLDLQAFTRMIREVIGRHEVLRCRFPLRAGQVVQVLDEQVRQCFEVPLHDLRTLPPEQREAEMRRWAHEQMQHPFDLQTELPWRTFVLQLDEQEYVSLTIMHHIVTDGWSWSIFHREFRELYAAFSQQQDSPLAELGLQYGDYAHWQRQWVESEVAQRQLKYWQRQLQGPLPVLDLPTDRERGEQGSARGQRVAIEIAPVLAQQVQALGRQAGATVFMTLLSALLILLYRYTQQEDMLVGTPIAGRTQPEVEPLFGCFLNTLVLRTKLGGETSVQELVQRVREVTVEAYDHQEYPFEKLVEVLQPERDLGRNPFFQVLFSLQNAPLEELAFHGLRWTPVEIETDTAKFALELALQETATGIVGYLEYQSEVFEPGTVERMGRHYVQILREMVRQPQQQIGELSLLQEQEQRLLLAGWNATETAYPAGGSYVGYVQAQVQAQPQALAVCDEREQLSYEQVWHQATRLAGHLQGLGIKPEQERLVGIYLDRSVTWAVSLLATLLVGGVYLPLDPSYPAGRLRHMVEHAGCTLVLTSREQERGWGELVGEQGAGVQVLRVQEVLEQEPQRAYQEVETRERQLAYVIYTSGSTGMPKGVMVEQRGMLNHLLAKVETLQLDAGDVLAQTASACFDISIWQVLAPWLVGAAVRIYPRSQVLDPQGLVEHLRTDVVSVLEVVPSLLRALIEEVEVRPVALTELRW
ncbi:MAG TPA: condensation domain-containing protein, partial [Ktedonobacteraceae bacterium]|nr:condensation domain-containing protein [Ktedonobacteraceae bacterium]